MTPALFASDREGGPRNIVLLHGFGGWNGIWDDVASGLSGRVIAYDLPGHGRSLTFAGAGPAKSAAHAILADLAVRGVDSAHLAGHSMGGAIAALIAIAEPARVASLTLLAPGGFGEEINGPLLRRYATAVSAGEIKACLAAMSGPKARVAEATVRGLEIQRGVPGQAEKLVEIAAAITRNDRQGIIPAESLAALAMPVTVVWGTADPVLPFSQTQNLPARFSLHGALEAGHMLIEEAPGLVTEIIRRTVG